MYSWKLRVYNYLFISDTTIIDVAPPTPTKERFMIIRSKTYINWLHIFVPASYNLPPLIIFSNIKFYFCSFQSSVIYDTTFTLENLNFRGLIKSSGLSFFDVIFVFYYSTRQFQILRKIIYYVIFEIVTNMYIHCKSKKIMYLNLYVWFSYMILINQLSPYTARLVFNLFNCFFKNVKVMFLNGFEHTRMININVI